MSSKVRSESPDDFLKRNNLDGYDRQLAYKTESPKLDKGKIGALRQLKDSVSDDKYKECN